MRKKCSKCRKIQDIRQFSKNATNGDGYDHYCKICNRKRMRQYFRSKKGKEAMKRASNKRKKLMR